MRRVARFAIALAAFAAAPAVAQSPMISQAIQAGEAGERYDGYMGVAGSPPPAVGRQVRAINIRRRNLYIGLAARRNATPELVGMATACQLLRDLPPGEAYMLSDRVWRHRAVGEPVVLPAYCR
jgi:uncharacterized protein YdbL (DUF1318 family)